MGNRLEGARAGERSCLGTGWGRGGAETRPTPGARSCFRRLGEGSGCWRPPCGSALGSGPCPAHATRHLHAGSWTRPSRAPSGSCAVAARSPRTPGVPARRVRPGAATPPVSPVLQALRVRNQRPCGTPEATPRRDPNPRWGVCDAASAHGTQFSAAWGCRARPPRSPRPARCLCGCPGLSEVTVLGTPCPPTPSCT